MHRVEIFTKEDCCLCQEAKAKLERLRREFDLSIREVDIAGDETIYQKYKNIIPVVVIDGEITLVSRISEFRLRKALASL